MKQRIKNQMDDFVINGRLTIEELYTLAKQEGFEKRELFFSVENPETEQDISTSHVVSFGKGWTKDTVIMHLTWTEISHMECCHE
jgi:hypothetical protein